ncbi:MAG: YceD family protein [Actinomycetota bacterium]
MNPLDPRGPLVLDLTRLERRPGSMVTVQTSVPAPAGLGLALAGVPEGSPIELDLRLESVMEGVLVSGTADVEVHAECSRCLDPVDWNEDVELRELFVYPATDARGRPVDVGDSDDDALPQVRDDLIDLEPVIRDAVVLGLPLAPVCDDDCRGLCPTCGDRLEDGHRHEIVDPRWAALGGLSLGEPPSTHDTSTTHTSTDERGRD